MKSTTSSIVASRFLHCIRRLVTSAGGDQVAALVFSGALIVPTLIVSQFGCSNSSTAETHEQAIQTAESGTPAQPTGGQNSQPLPDEGNQAIPQPTISAIRETKSSEVKEPIQNKRDGAMATSLVEEIPAVVLPSQTEMRDHFIKVINAKVTQSSNTMRRAYDAATSGIMNADGIGRDVLAVSNAEDDIEVLVKVHGANLSLSLAELCFDPEERIASAATELLTSLGDPAIQILSAEQPDKRIAKASQFAMAKAFRRKAPNIAPALLWAEVLEQSSYGQLALSELSESPGLTELNSDQLQFLAKGIRSADKIQSQNCLIIAAKVKNPDAATLDAIQERAHSTDYLASNAINILMKYPERRKVLCNELIELLSKARTNRSFGHDDSAHIRVTLAQHIQTLKPDAEDLSPLVSKLADPQESHKVRVAISELFRDAGEASLSPLISLLNQTDTSAEGRLELLKSLGIINLACGPVLLELTKWMKAGDRRERQNAIGALQAMGADAASALNALFEATKDPETGRDAMGAIGRIVKDPDEAMMRRLLPMLESRNDYVVGDATQILVAAGSKSSAVLTDILRLSRSNNNGVRAAAASILGAIGDSNPTVVSRLTEMTTENGSFVRQRAIQSLGQLGVGAKSAAPALAAIVANGRDDQERYDAIWTLIQFDDGSPTVIDALKAVYAKKGPREYQRYSAVALICLGEPATNYRRDLHYLMENAYSGESRKFADIAARQMLSIDPENRLAKDAVERQKRYAD